MNQGHEVDLYAEAASLAPEKHDDTFVQAVVLLHGSADAAIAYQQPFVEAGEQNVADAESALEVAKAEGDEEQIERTQRVRDGHRRTLATYRRWQARLRQFAQDVQPDVRPAGHTHVARLRSATPRRRGSGRPAGRRTVRSSARSGDSGDSSDEPEPPRVGRPHVHAGVLA